MRLIYKTLVITVERQVNVATQFFDHSWVLTDWYTTVFSIFMIISIDMAERLLPRVMH
jgi:hypothetical protein